MQQKKKYRKPEITRIKLNAGEAIMGNCSSTTARTLVVKTSSICRTAAISCRNSVS
jgi:hypothetical protein